jgi:ketosteroid isomerase-like protein
MRRSLILSVALGLTLGNCAPREPSGPGQVREAWRRHFNARNTDAVLDLYAEDATLVTEAGTFHGRNEIRRWIQVSLDQGSSLEAIEADQEKSSGTLAYGTGRSTRLVGREVHLGRYLIVLEKTGAGWKIVQHFSMNVR